VLSRIGPGTPFGEALRRYWTPACLASSVAQPDGDPVGVRLLGEDLVIFRDTAGRLGCLDEYCGHRTASLLLGRVEEQGIRCLYHGWKFAVDGALLEAPNHPNPGFCSRVRQPAYSVVEAGGLVWVYMGPPERKPEMPRYPFMGVAKENRAVVAAKFACHYLQALEGGLDTAHLGSLHLDYLREVDERSRELSTSAVFKSIFARVEAAPAQHGLDYVAIRPGLGQHGKASARIAALIAPWTVCIAPGNLCGIYVAADDQTTLAFLVAINTEDNPSGIDSVAPAGGGFHEDTLRAYGITPETFEAKDRPVRTNNFKQDRQAIRAGRSSSGLPQILPADYAMVCSMEPFADRGRENLVPMDAPIALLRRLMLESIERVEAGGDPIGLDATSYMEKINAVEGTLDEHEEWRNLAPNHVFT
jgi:phthalate 4,5-dioxygenase